ncbi:lipase family protein [Corynebacterium xerosis]|uniref:lipase family protein n=1 Tax=Corynebacterium xerosis TaxID=1725 RepID=UPI003671A353
MPPHRRRHRHGIGTASALILAAEHLSRGAAGVIIDHHRNPDAGSQEYVDNISSGESLKEVIFERYPFILDELERHELGKRTPTHPTMLYAGVHDDIIPVNQIRKIRNAWTAGGADLKFVEDATISIPGKTAANHIVPMLSQLIPSIDCMWPHLAPGHQPAILSLGALPSLGFRGA